MQRIHLPEHTILIIPDEGEIKREEAEKIISPDERCALILKSGFTTHYHFTDEPEPRYIPIDQQKKKEEVAWLIKQLRATNDYRTHEIIKSIIDKIS